MNYIKKILAVIFLVIPIGLFSQGTVQGGAGSRTWPAPGETAVGLRRITLFSSGLGLFEHSGKLSGPGRITLPFHINAVNDALKSLLINDPASLSEGAAPSVSYDSETTLAKTLRSLKIDLSGDPDTARLLSSLKGAEIEVFAPNQIKGRIITVEYRDSSSAREPWLSLLTRDGVRLIPLSGIVSFSFSDLKLQGDLIRALNLFESSRESENRNLLVSLPGTGSRDVSLGYIIPAPVWKVSYRLDLDRDKPLFQGWAIVDNDSDTDWENVELTLVMGRPASFIQNLYPPYYTSRPVLPLSIAGIAQGRSYGSGWGGSREMDEGAGEYQLMARPMMAEDSKAMTMMERALSPAASPMQGAIAGSVNAAASGQAAGEQFSFTLKKPISLPRQQSAMLPLLDGTIQAKKAWIFSGERAVREGTVNPTIGAEITNTTGMKLPAGPIAVFSGGTYGGDALIEFLSENEKRLVSFGDDLSVIGSAVSSSTRSVSAVTVSSGVMTITRRVSHERKYHFKNASAEAKRLIIEHPVTQGTTLKDGQSYAERTNSLYRFERNLAAKGEMDFSVIEENPVSEQHVLARFSQETLLSYSSNQEIPARVRDALKRAAELRRIADDARTAQAALETRRTRQAAEQGRIRQNLEAAGSQTPQGQQYLSRMAELDAELDLLAAQLTDAEKNAQDTLNAYNSYLASLKLE